MLRQFLDRALGARRTEDQTSDDAPDDREGSSRRVEEALPNETSDDYSKRASASRKVASTVAAAPTKYPLSWPARDLARSRRLQSQETMMRSRARKPGSAEEPDSDPTVVWRPPDGGNGDGG